jgi:hypothetical protein
MSEDRFVTRTGGCHCGRVRFEVVLPPVVEVQDCNCSICAKTGFAHVIVPQSRFFLREGVGELTEYRFNTGAALHLFCKTCGVKSFYRPRSNPDGWSVNFLCIDQAEDLDVRRSAFDGRNWERHGAELAHLSKDAS